MLYRLYKIGKYLALHLPLSASYGIAVFVADLYNLFSRRDKQNLTENLKVVMKTDDLKLIRSHVRTIFRNFAKYLVDFFRFDLLTSDYIVNHFIIEGKENVDKALAAGRGGIMVSAHLGNWELGAAITASLGYPLYAIVLDHKDPRINEFFLKQRAQADVRPILIGAQLKRCFRVLKGNRFLAIAGDRTFTDHGVKTHFFGRPTTLPKGPAFFSLRTGAAIIPTFAVRTKDDRCRLIFEEPIRNPLSGDNEADIRSIMQAYIPVMERYIRAFPDQWYAFRKVWE